MSELAQQLIAKEKKERTGHLNLANCGLTELPPEVLDCDWLETLILSDEWYEYDLEGRKDQLTKSQNTGDANNLQFLPANLSELRLLKNIFFDHSKVNDLTPLANLSNLQKLSCSTTQVSDLRPLAGLVNLEELYCQSTQVADLTPLTRLVNLQKLNCYNTQVLDLTPLAGLVNLQKLSCSTTQVSDLRPLAGLVNLEGLYCSTTQVSDLTPLAGLVNLQVLFCDNTQVSDLTPLTRLVNLQRLYCNNTQVSDLTPLAGLVNLQRLNCDNTQVSDLMPLSMLVNLQTLFCDNTQVSDLTPLNVLVNLQGLSCSTTQVADLSPLSKLVNLQKLSCSTTQVSDLRPLAGLVNLEELYCQSTQVADLSPLSKLVNLQKLSCSTTQVSDLRPLAGLVNLQILDCSTTQVSDLIPLTRLINLKKLYCNNTQVSDLTPLAGLVNLQTLFCDNTQVSDLTPLNVLVNLQVLFCDNTQVSDLTPLNVLVNLQHLLCHDTQVSDLMPLAGLVNLQDLFCHNTQVSDLMPLAGLVNLQTLSCDNTQVSDLTPLNLLVNLQNLYCTTTQVSDLTPLNVLVNLQQLYCATTQVSDLTPLAGLVNLLELSCATTQVSDLTPLAGLVNLQRLLCDTTQVSDLAPLSGFRQLKTLSLESCKNIRDSNLTSLFQLVKNGLHIKTTQRTLEEDEEGIFVQNTRLSKNMIAAIKAGDQAVFDYAKRKKELLFETRVLIVGEPRAGKTALRAKLKDTNATLPTEFESTKGMEVEIETLQCRATFKSSLIKSKTSKLKYNLWDFGGQEMYKILHQLFVTEGAAYVIVTNTDVNKNEDELEFWLETIEKLGKSTIDDESYGPVILLQNAKTDRPEFQSFRTLREKFKFWKQDRDFVINLNRIANKTAEDKERFDRKELSKFVEFKKYLENSLQSLPHIGEEIPVEWIKIRQELSKLIDKNYIPLESFREICIKNGIPDPDEQLRLSRMLHILGVLFHYQDNDVLRNIVILNRQWASDALYRVLDNKIVTENGGWFERENAKEIWSEKQYQDKTIELLSIMQEFKMCYLNESSKRYIVPSKLPFDPPEKFVWDTTDNVQLHLQYDWLPRPVVTQLMVALHENIAQQQTWIWRKGAVIEGTKLDAKDAQARIVENIKEHKIEINSKGHLSEYIIRSILDKWREVHAQYEGKVKVKRILLCNCEKCNELKSPFEFDYEDVLEAKVANEPLRCNKSRRDLTASEILRGIIDEKTVSQDLRQKFPDRMEDAHIGKRAKLKGITNKKEYEEENTIQPVRTIKIFLASSAELIIEREKIEIEVNRINKELHKKGIFLFLSIWEDAQCVGKSFRSQDDYNLEVEACDIFVMLFFSKVGKYTLEEFKIAKSRFDSSANPRIFIFQKDVNLPKNQSEKDAKSRFKFLNDLQKCEHFPILFENTDALLKMLGERLDKFSK